MAEDAPCLRVSPPAVLLPQRLWPGMRRGVGNAAAGLAQRQVTRHSRGLKELIADAEERLDRLERGTDNGRAAE
jgi:hypothetical protein